MRVWIGAIAAACLMAMPAIAQTVSLTGVDGATVALTQADIAALPRHSVSLAIHGETHVFEGPSLASVLERIDAPLGERLRGPALLTYVTVRAADGYGVALSLAEIDPAMSPTAVLLADRVDGAPIGPEDGPFRLVVEGDARPARSARQVTSIALATSE